MRILAMLTWGLCAAIGTAQQPFELDSTFRTTILLDGFGGPARVSSILPLASGDILLSGRVKFPGDEFARSVALIDMNGAQVQSFPYATGGGKLTRWNDRFYVSNGGVVARFYLDGTTDTEFNMLDDEGFSFGQMGGYHVFDDGRVVITGDHIVHDSAHGFEGYYQLIWFTNEGRLDTTRIHRRCDGFIYQIFPLPDGKFLLSGSWTEYEGTPVPNSTRLIRVFADGSLDTTFQAPLDFVRPDSHYLMPNGKHLLTGIMGLTNDDDTLQMVKLLPDGGLDSSFNNHAQLVKTYDDDPPWCSIVTAHLLSDDRFIVTGSFTFFDGEPRGGIAMIDSQGHLMDDFFVGAECGVWNDGFQDRAYIWGITPAPDGSYYIYGSYHGYDDGTTNDLEQRMVSRLYGLNVGVGEHNTPQLKVWPNPGEGIISITIPIGWAMGSFSVYDQTGRCVLTRPYTQQVTFDSTSLCAGSYSVELLNQTGRRIVTLWMKT